MQVEEEVSLLSTK